MKFYHKDRQNEDEHRHFLRTRINNENVWEKNVYHIDDQIFASVLSHLNFTLYSDQTTITFKLLGIRGCILGIVTFLLGSPGWY